MTIEQFNQMKETTKCSLEKKLELARISKELPTNPSLTKIDYKIFSVYNDSSQVDVLQEMLSFAKSVNGDVTHEPIEDGKGRIGYYEYTEYKVEYKELVDEISEAIIKSRMHTALINIMGMSQYGYIDCKIMQLFKDGKLSWEDTVEAHKTNCSF